MIVHCELDKSDFIDQLLQMLKVMLNVRYVFVALWIKLCIMHTMYCPYFEFCFFYTFNMLLETAWEKILHV